jgi:hypothetical protein
MSIAATRARRVPRRPITYWEEYVDTDPWYQAEMLADVPPEELTAALEDEDFSASDDGSGAEQEELDPDFEPISDGPSECSWDASSGCTESDAATELAAADAEEEGVHWSAEGESGSESADAESQIRS